MLRSGSCNTSEMARHMTHDTKEDFKANDMRIYRFLQSREFQVDDKLWRNYINLVFDVMEERGLLKKGDRISIKVDFTSATDDFLILSAGVDFNGRTVPLYFTMRNYPKRSGSMDQKKMEAAFIKGLRHVLSKKYTYVIVADRGFGNDRFSKACIHAGFDYLLRINDNLGLTIDEKETNLNTFAGSTFDITANVNSWKKSEHRFVGCTKADDYWVIFTSLKDAAEELGQMYSQRFGIEKQFQDQKSSGFDIEKSKIKKYDRFKRMYFIVCLSQLFTVVIGEFLENKNHPIKKKYPVYTSLVLAFSSWDEKLFAGFLTDV